MRGPLNRGYLKIPMKDDCGELCRRRNKNPQLFLRALLSYMGLCTSRLRQKSATVLASSPVLDKIACLLQG